MKTHEFRDACIAATVVFGMLCLLTFGFVWLGKQYDVEDQILDARKEFDHQLEMLAKESKINFIDKNQIIPSCLKGEKTWTKEKNH